MALDPLTNKAMFDRIAPTYDRLNHLLSLGIDRGWRRKAVRRLLPFRPRRVLDACCGTGDFSILLRDTLKAEVTGCDLSEGMMQIAREKAPDLRFEPQDCLHLTYGDASFDVVACAYGVRNFESLEDGLREFRRVLEPGGHLLILELSVPRRWPMTWGFWIYSRLIMRLIGRLVSRDRSAYAYLPESMAAFPQAEEVKALLQKIGFRRVKFHRYLFGRSTCFLAEK